MNPSPLLATIAAPSPLRTLVVKLGGSYLLAEGKANVTTLQDMAKLMGDIIISNKADKVVVVVGGGQVARSYIDSASALGSNNGIKDQFGIFVSRLNARLFIEAFNNHSAIHKSIRAYPEPPESLPEVAKALAISPVVVLGGLQPGQSTTAVSALCAEFTNAEQIVFSTNVTGVYNKDPRKFKDAVKFDSMTFEQLRKIMGSKSNTAPGTYRIIDNVGLSILERSDIPAVICEGTVSNIRELVFNKSNIGTRLYGQKSVPEN